jgi:putative flavoprotein involved in K+ transport
MERKLGRWVAREDFVAYVERYSKQIEPNLRLGTEVSRLERDEGCWRLRTSAGEIHARAVVVATGLNCKAHMPTWPGADCYEGELIHASAYSEPTPFIGRDVLVAGLGASGGDIAIELARAGAVRVRIAVRTPPLIYRRHISTALMSQLVKHAPVPDALFDRLSLLLHDVLWGDLSAFGLDRPKEGMATSLARRGHGATMDRGLVAAVKCGRIEVVPAVAGFEQSAVLLSDETRVTPSAVIAATGQRPDLDRMVGHLGVLGQSSGRPVVHGAGTLVDAPGLHFLGFRLPAGQLPDMAIDARLIALRIARTLKHSSAVE